VSIRLSDPSDVKPESYVDLIDRDALRKTQRALLGCELDVVDHVLDEIGG
jgi:hypothetical protein